MATSRKPSPASNRTTRSDAPASRTLKPPEPGAIGNQAMLRRRLGPEADAQSVQFQTPTPSGSPAPPPAQAPAPQPAQQPPNQSPPITKSTCTVDRIDIVDTSSGAIGGYNPLPFGGDLNKPGPYNDPQDASVTNVHQIHFHLDQGNSTSLDTLERTLTKGTATKGSSKPLTVTNVADGPKLHEVQFPSADKVVIADAPGFKPYVLSSAADYPASLTDEFTILVAENNVKVASIQYKVSIIKENDKQVPNKENKIVSVQKSDIVRGKSLP